MKQSREAEVMNATLKITPEIDWSCILKSVPLEELEAELSRRESAPGSG